jgi:hypothetical protein
MGLRTLCTRQQLYSLISHCVRHAPEYTSKEIVSCLLGDELRTRFDMSRLVGRAGQIVAQSAIRFDRTARANLAFYCVGVVVGSKYNIDITEDGQSFSASSWLSSLNSEPLLTLVGIGPARRWYVTSQARNLSICR